MTVTPTSTFDFNSLIDGVSRVHTVRVAMLDGNPWFVASDVCKVLEISQPTFAYRRLDAEDQRTVDRSSLGLAKGAPMYVISEPGLYDLITRSDKPQAQPFRRWVNREVLPSIRKTGSYALPKGEVMPLPADFADSLEQFAKLAIEHAKTLRDKARTEAELAAADAARQQAEEELERVKPMALVGERAAKIERTVHVVTGTFHGVNRNAVPAALESLGYLKRNIYTRCYYVPSKHRDKLFAQRPDPQYGTLKITVLPEGLALLERLYRAGQLPMKKGFSVALI